MEIEETGLGLREGILIELRESDMRTKEEVEAGIETREEEMMTGAIEGIHIEEMIEITTIEETTIGEMTTEEIIEGMIEEIVGKRIIMIEEKVNHDSDMLIQKRIYSLSLLRILIIF